MNTAAVGDVEMCYELVGEGPPLVMIMGYTANMDWWRLRHYYEPLRPCAPHRYSGPSCGVRSGFSLSIGAIGREPVTVGCVRVCRASLVSGKVFMPASVALRKADVAFGYIHPCMSCPLEDITIGP